VRVLVTGATGFIGQHVVAAIARRGHQVRALTRRADNSVRPVANVEFVLGDLLESDTIRSALANVDAVVHLAIAATPEREILVDESIQGAENLCSAMVAAGVERLVHCSSRAVYDATRAQSLDELAPLQDEPNFRDDYSKLKVTQEKIIGRHAAEHGWNVTILRPGFVWGAGREQLAGWGYSLGPLHLVVDGGRRLPMTYVENCAECFALALEQPAAAGEAFNIVDDDLPTAREFAGLTLKLADKGGLRVSMPYWPGMWLAKLATGINRTLFGGRVRMPGLFSPAIYRARFRPLHFSNQKAKKLLGWQPRYDFRQSWQRARSGAQGATATSNQPAAAALQEAARGK
jgi:nucleoside-diphosphate-sugar epimerase